MVKHIVAVVGDDSATAKEKIHASIRRDMSATVRGRLPIMCAAERGAWKVVSELLENQVDPNILDSTGRPILYWALRITSYELRKLFGSDEDLEVCIKRLLHYGADPNFTDSFDRTSPLF